MLPNVIFLDAIDFRSENEDGIAVPEDRSRIGLLKIDAHFVIAPHAYLAALGGGILHHRGIFDVLDIGGERMKVLRGLVQHGQDAIKSPTGSRLRRDGLQPESGAAKTNHQEKKGNWTSQT